ncbi:hypothetical protein IQ225_19175, partial [Synechocystis salina LEGE 06155]|nr:hypothetical protein [Synechocystis salina LEGE 06155]
ASSFPFVFYLEPVLNLVSILKGQPASCSLKIFWRRERSLNYQTANLLLSQWNYAGALKILEQWSSKLSMLCEYKLDASDIEELNKSQSNLSKILEALRIADFCFNLDMKQVQSQTIQWQNKFGELPPDLTKLTKPINSENYNIILNLYTQCRIFWEIDQIANFLARMQSFYEAVLKQLLSSLEMDSYIDIDKNTGNWNPNDQKITNQDLTRYITKFRNDQKKNGHPVRNLSSRISQKILIKCFIGSFSTKDQRLTNEILKCLDELDYWCVQRNNLIHRAKGISKATMQELDEEKRTFNKNSCESDKICSVMANICKNPLCAIPQELRENYVEPSLNFYLYSNARSWIQELLREEAKKI